MSFAICVCGLNFSVMMSDGRLVKIPNNTVVREDVPKVIKFNRNVSMAYTGDPIPTQIAIGKLEEYDIINLSMEEIETIIINELKNLRYNMLGVKLIVSGRNQLNQFVVHTIDSKENYKIQQFYPSNEGIIYACAGNNDTLCNHIVLENFTNVQIATYEQLENIMTKCICDVASLDETVNTNIFKVVIS